MLDPSDHVPFPLIFPSENAPLYVDLPTLSTPAPSAAPLLNSLSNVAGDTPVWVRTPAGSKISILNFCSKRPSRTSTHCSSDIKHAEKGDGVWGSGEAQAAAALSVALAVLSFERAVAAGGFASERHTLHYVTHTLRYTYCSPQNKHRNTAYNMATSVTGDVII